LLKSTMSDKKIIHRKSYRYLHAWQSTFQQLLTATSCRKASVVWLFCVALFLLSPASVIYTSLSSDTLTVGDIIELRISLVTPPNSVIKPPLLQDSIGPIVIKNQMTRSVSRKNSDSTCFSYLLTVYDAVQCTIPRLTYTIEKDSAHRDSLWCEPIPLRVISVLQGNEGDTLKIKDIKPQQIAGTPSYTWLWILCGFILLTVLFFMIRRFLKRRQQIKTDVPPPKPPYEEAVEALAALEAKKYLQKGLVREYVFELSEIFKRYIERRFTVSAAEFTTEEMIEWIGFSTLDEPLKKNSVWFFDTTHPVKFAKAIPDSACIEKLLSEVKYFLEKTRVTEHAPASVGTVQSEGDKQ
ncbi:MAG: hypothetical protein JW795_19970, partial [Chitinivibrionales bacterium]|nr:hypothetical protein [Chitinivibrionales bacterium]